MSTREPTVVLVHGAFAESASWDAVITQLQARQVDAVAVANPLRGVAGDAAYVRDVVDAIGAPVVLVGHSYGGHVITEAASRNDDVVALVHVAAFAPEQGESAIELSAKFPGSTLGDALTAYPLRGGGNDLVIRQALFHRQFAADVPPEQATLMAATQRPVAEAALAEGLPTDSPAWRTLPSWFVFGDADRNIPVAVQRFMAGRAEARSVRELAGGSHALAVSRPGEVAATILDAVQHSSG